MIRTSPPAEAPAGLQAWGLTELDAFLAGDRVQPRGMRLSGVDGLLTALAIGPHPVPEPEAWLPLVWGGDDPAFHDLEEARLAVYAIMDRLVAIRRQLDEAPDRYRPVLRTLDDGALSATEWAQGFLAGVELSRARWQALRCSKHAWPAFVLLSAQLRDHDAAIIARHGAASVARFRDGARDLLPALVAEIDRFWRDQTGATSAGGRAARRHPSG